MEQKRIRFFDSTLRDGSHAIGHGLTTEAVARYCQKVDGSGLEVVIVGHGNGLGASSLQTGLSLLTDAELLAAGGTYARLCQVQWRTSQKEMQALEA